jgi:hypothetical protein
MPTLPHPGERIPAGQVDFADRKTLLDKRSTGSPSLAFLPVKVHEYAFPERANMHSRRVRFSHSDALIDCLVSRSV